MATDPPTADLPGPGDASAAAATGEPSKQQAARSAGRAEGTRHARAVLRGRPDAAAHDVPLIARIPADPALRPHFLAGLAEGILTLAQQALALTEAVEAIPPVCPHACGLCDGPMRFAGMEGEYATFACTRCGWWHIAKDCCHEAEPASMRGPAPDDRWYVVVIRDPDGQLSGLARRMPGPDGEPFAGPWGALTSEEASALADAWNADPAEGGTAEVVELYRYNKDPAGPDESAGPAVTTDGRWSL